MPLHPLPATVKAFPAVAEREEELLVVDIAEAISHSHALAMRGGTKTDFSSGLRVTVSTCFARFGQLH
jgi:hypothetical protein